MGIRKEKNHRIININLNMYLGHIFSEKRIVPF